MSEAEAGNIGEDERRYLVRCVELARETLALGNRPYGSLLVDAGGEVLFEDRNRTKDGDATRHPEFEIARWAAANLTPEERRLCTVYTSGEHCPMCSSAHALVGLGRIVYAASTEQHKAWYREWGIAMGPVTPLPITEVAPSIPVAGPDPELSQEVRGLLAQMLGVEPGQGLGGRAPSR